MSLKALQDYTFVSKYARYDKNKKRRETWHEAVTRVKEMHLRKYPQIADEIEWAFEQVKNKKVLGSQRALQYGGKPIEKINERIYNCAASYCDRLRFFQETMFLLLAGSGVGFSIQKHHVAKLPSFNEHAISNTFKEKKVFLIPDSIEGWADSLGVLLSSYFESPVFPEYYGHKIVFDFSSIRPENSPLSSGVGKAPGPEPLRSALAKITAFLEDIISQGYNKLKPIHAYDIVMHSSDAVLSGGVRRSATLAIFSPDDKDMLNAKIGSWLYDNPQRGRSNNSALLVRNETSFEDFKKVIESTKQYGEPGFIFSESKECLFNPCVEISFYAYDDEGNSGYQYCNLTEINGKKIKTKEDFRIAAKASAIIGTCQAGYTDFHYLGKVTENITRKEALLGCSITGYMENPEILLNPEIQREMAEYIKEVNLEISKKIGINPAARTTCSKPSGTTSCLLGTSSGIHPHHAKRYFRRVQANNLEKPFQYFLEHNPLAVEKSVWSANDTDSILTFCIEVEKGAKVKNDLSAIQLLEYVRSTQQNWVEYGTREENNAKSWLRNNVSNTISVKEEEWDEVAEFIYENRKYFAGVSLIPSSGDLDYPQAPFSTVHTPKELVSIYGDGVLMASGLIVDGLHAFKDNLWQACDAVLGFLELEEPIKPDVSADMYLLEEYESQLKIWNTKIDWIRRVKQFAKRYCDNDVKKTTYLLKEVSNWKHWCDLNREFKEVDYTNLIEEEDNTKFTQETACAGGTCQIV